MNMIRKYKTGAAAVLLVLTAVLLLGLLAPDASADLSPLDPEKDCTLTLKIPVQFEDELTDVEITANLYRFASVDADVNYTALDPFAGRSAVPADMNLIRTYTADQLTELAGALKKIAEDSAAQAVPVVKSSGEKSVKSKPLKPGLYLVDTNIFESAENRYSSVPFVVALPNVGTVTRGGQAAQDWVYDLEAVLKLEVEEMFGAIRLVKHVPAVRRYEKTPDGSTQTVEYGICNAVFKVTGTKNGKEVYSDVITLSLDGSESLDGNRWLKKEHVIRGIPVGTKITVEEAYAGGPYRLTDTWLVPAGHTSEVTKDGIIEFHFKNEYDSSRKYSTGAVNHFEISENSNDYNWIPNYTTPDEETTGKADSGKGGK